MTRKVDTRMTLEVQQNHIIIVIVPHYCGYVGESKNQTDCSLGE